MEEKKRRQIIMVSHNANLVVLSDAENVIVSNKHGHAEGVYFEYENGAIEDERIRKSIVNILEGGEAAFRRRAEKLNLK